jgi:HAD superfamily hydrolase (TIGR01509 family)
MRDEQRDPLVEAVPLVEPVETQELQAVLFDMDGTICETEPAWMTAEQAMAREYGATWTREDGLALVGNNLIDSGVYIKRRMNLPQSPEAVVEELVDRVVVELAAHDIEWRPGAVELLTACNEAGLPTALVTMSYDRFADAVVKALPGGRFDVVVTGESVERGKPHPDAYLMAADLLGVAPAGTVAIEDSPTGAASAEAAGCRVVVVPNHVEVPLTPARVEVASLLDLDVPRLKSLVNGAF